MRLVGGLALKCPSARCRGARRLVWRWRWCCCRLSWASPIFELISPIGAVNKGLVFGGLAGCGHAFGHRYRRAARQPSFVVPGTVPLGWHLPSARVRGASERRHRSRRLHPLRQVHPRLPRRPRDSRAGAGGGRCHRACRRLHGLRRLRGRMPHFRPALPPRASPPARFEERCKQGVTVPFLYRCCPHEYERNCPFSVAGFTA